MRSGPSSSGARLSRIRDALPRHRRPDRRPTGGSCPVMAVSCSSTSQRSYPWRSRRRDDLLDAARLPARAAGTAQPAWPATSVELAGAHARGHARVDVLEVDVDDAVGVVARRRRRGRRRRSAGGRCRGTSRRRCRRAARSTSASRLHERAGVRVQREAEAVGGDELVDLGAGGAERAASSSSSSAMRRRPGVVDHGAATNTSAPAAARSRDAVGVARGRRRAPARAATSGTKPPTSRSPWRSSTARSARGVERQVAERAELGGA